MYHLRGPHYGPIPTLNYEAVHINILFNGLLTIYWIFNSRLFFSDEKHARFAINDRLYHQPKQAKSISKEYKQCLVVLIMNRGNVGKWAVN